MVRYAAVSLIASFGVDMAETIGWTKRSKRTVSATETAINSVTVFPISCRTFSITCADCLPDADRCSHRKAHNHDREHVHHLRAGRYGSRAGKASNCPNKLCNGCKVKRREKVFQLRVPTGFAVTAARRKEGLAPEYLQKIIGHANYATTADVYTHIDAETLVSAVTNTLPTNQK